VGGFVKGRIVEIWGPDGIGKTFLCLCAVRQAQLTDPDRIVAYIDAENKAADPWADALGVDRARWMKYVPTTAEDAADAAKKFLAFDPPIFSMVVVDSIGALISRAELEAQADKAKMAEVARIVTRMMGVMTAFAQQRQVAVILVNQLREKIDSSGNPAVMRFKQYARTGGWKLKYSTTMGLKVGGSQKQPTFVTIKDTKHIAAREISVKVERNKVWPEGPVVNILLQTVEVDDRKPGIDQAEEVLSLAPKLGVIGREGVKYVLPGGQWFRGEQHLRDHLHANPELVAELRQTMVGLNAPVALADPDPEGNPADEVEVEPVAHPMPRIDAEAPSSPVEAPEAEKAPATPSEAPEASWEPPGGWDADATAGWE
jgi:recombination protein RecA